MVLKTVKRYWFLAKTAAFIAYAVVRTVWEFRGEIDYEMTERDREELEKLKDELNSGSMQCPECRSGSTYIKADNTGRVGSDPVDMVCSECGASFRYVSG